MLYRLKVLRTSRVPVDSLRGLRLLCRQRAELMEDVTRYKNRLTAYLDQVFRGAEKRFLTWEVPRPGPSHESVQPRKSCFSKAKQS